MSFLQTVFNWLPKLRAPDNSLLDAKCDAAGNLQVSVAANTSATTTWVDPANGAPLVASRIIAAAPKKLWRVTGTNEGSSERWVMIFASATVPGNGAEPVLAYRVPAGGFFADEMPRAKSFSSGISWAASSTAGTLTIDSGATFRMNFEVE
jgi:hypothetical protein